MAMRRTHFWTSHVFFRGESKDHVVNILDGCGAFTDLGIYGLIDESLISLADNRIEMPNIFQDMGRFVVCQESNEKGKRSRLWDSNDIVDVLTNNSGSEAIEGIFLDASGLTLELNPTVFERIYRLRFLKLHYPTSKTFCKVSLPQGLDFLPDELRLLHWERYPLGSLPRNFNPKNLVELNMPYSNLTKLWKGTKNLEKLKRIILSHSQQLTEFPRLSKARNLEHIDLEGCTSLVKVNSSILHHHKLTFLSLKDCLHLRVMPTTVYLESLEVLNLSGCSELEDFQGFSPNLKELYLAGTAITEMPASFGNLTRLVTLDLENCSRLQQLPPEISNLKAVVTLSAKRPASSMDVSSVEDTAPPYKRYRLKRVIESVILSLRKRKREKSVSTAKKKDRNCDFGVSDAKRKSILETSKKLEDPDMPAEALVELLQNLEYIDITLQDLQETNIGRHVVQLRKHRSKNVQRLAKHLVEKWKETVEESLTLKYGDPKPPSVTGSAITLAYKSKRGFNVLPERPGRPECAFYRKTGNCRFGNDCRFHHTIDRETHALESSLSFLGLPSRPGKPVCAPYFSTGMCSSGPTCVFDHPSMVSTQKKTSSMASEARNFSPLASSFSIGDSSSELVEPSINKLRIDKKASSVASETPHLNSLEVSSSTVSEITQTTVGRYTLDIWDFDDKDF